MIKIDTAIILAAGFGKRLLPLTKDQPKPMVKLAGKPLIDWQIQRLKAAGISKLLINGHYQHKILFDHLAQYFDISLFYEPELLDTGGAILNMMAKMGASFPEYFIVTNCDSLYFDQDLHQNEYQILCKYFDPNLHKALLLLADSKAAIGYDGTGDFGFLPASSISSIPATIIRGGDYIFTGKQILSKHIFQNINDSVFSLNLLYDQIMAENGLFGMVKGQKWYHIGDPATLDQVEKQI